MWTPQRIWISRACGEVCTACGVALRSGEWVLEFDEFRHPCLHFACFKAWEHALRYLLQQEYERRLTEGLDGPRMQ